MSDTESLIRAQDGAAAPERHRVLCQIAAVLDLPVTAFTERRSFEDVSHASGAECAAMLEAYKRIADAGLRASCLRLLQSFSH